MTIDLTLVDTTKNCAAGAGMAIYVWHCDRAGDYSLYSQDAAEQNYLRGVQVADQNGRVSFTSIFPACYSGRWPHIHFEVFDSLESAVAGENARLTSQIALPEDACTAVFAHDSGYAASVQNISRVTLDSDNVFGDGWDGELASVTGDPARGMTVALTIGVGEKSANTPPDGGPRHSVAHRRTGRRLTAVRRHRAESWVRHQLMTLTDRRSATCAGSEGSERDPTLSRGPLPKQRARPVPR